MILRCLENNLIALDQLLNTLLLGEPDETLSSRAFRADQANKIFGRIFRPTIDLIFFWQDNHCKQSFLSEINKKQLPKYFQQI